MTKPDWAPYEITPERSTGGDAAPEALVELLAATDVGELLAREGAVLMRGFRVEERDLPAVLAPLLPERLAYVQGNTPRTRVGDNVYTSTEYPPEYPISLHNELSYAHEWPARLLFYCAEPAAGGGATPLLRGTDWLAALDPRLREDFRDGLRYRRYLHGGNGLGKSWQATFETPERAEVEKVLTAADATWEWTPGGALRTSQLRPATTRHPVTGAEVWFNQVDQWHPAALGEETMRELASIVPADELPQSVAFADGTEIPDEYALAVRDLGLELAADVAWRRGDVLLVDNVAVAHGRRPFTGSRRVLVAMSR